MHTAELAEESISSKKNPHRLHDAAIAGTKAEVGDSVIYPGGELNFCPSSLSQLTPEPLPAHTAASLIIELQANPL